MTNAGKGIRKSQTVGDNWWNGILAEDSKKGTSDADNVTSDTIRDAAGKTDWELVEEHYQNETVIECSVIEWNRGGLIVRHASFQGFLPTSHIVDGDNEILSSNLRNYIGRDMKLRIIEYDANRSRVILSERAAQTKPGERKKLLEKIEDGQIIQGSVTTITKFGVFLDIGGLEGLIHISEISWRRISQPANIVNFGDQIKALVLDVDRERARVALSVKQLHPNPWDTVRELYKEGDTVLVEITEVVRFGAFAKVNEDLEGLIHISEMGLPDDVHPWKRYKVGQGLSARILSIDPTEQRLSLSLLDEPADEE